MSGLTKETARRMFDKAGKSISLYERNADKCAALLTLLESKTETDMLNALRGILNTSLMLDFINLDLCAAYRQYLSAELSTKYDKRQAITKINVIMSEGYKKIYGFEGDSRKSSYWINQIKTVVDFLGDFDKEYMDLEGKLKNFGNNNILNKDMRDLTVHYDAAPMRVYKMLSELSAEDVSKRCSEFYCILNKITVFVSCLTCIMKSRILKAVL